MGGDAGSGGRVCPENLKLFTDLTFSAIILTLDERTSAPADLLF
jgi:hypothetical protein